MTSPPITDPSVNSPASSSAPVIQPDDDAANYLQSVPGLPDETRDAAWNAFYGTKDHGEFERQFNALKMPDEAKDALWNIKFNGVKPSIIPKSAPGMPGMLPGVNSKVPTPVGLSGPAQPRPTAPQPIAEQPQAPLPQPAAASILPQPAPQSQQPQQPPLAAAATASVPHPIVPPQPVHPAVSRYMDAVRLMASDTLHRMGATPQSLDSTLRGGDISAAPLYSQAPNLAGNVLPPKLQPQSDADAAMSQAIGPQSKFVQQTPNQNPETVQQEVQNFQQGHAALTNDDQGMHLAAPTSAREVANDAKVEPVLSVPGNDAPTGAHYTTKSEDAQVAERQQEFLNRPSAQKFAGPLFSGDSVPKPMMDALATELQNRTGLPIPIPEVKGLLDTLGSLASPQNIATMAITPGGPVGRAAASAFFAPGLIRGAWQQANQAVQDFKDGDNDHARRNAAAAFISAVMGALAAHHAISGTAGLIKSGLDSRAAAHGEAGTAPEAPEAMAPGEAPAKSANIGERLPEPAPEPAAAPAAAPASGSPAEPLEVSGETLPPQQAEAGPMSPEAEKVSAEAAAKPPTDDEITAAKVRSILRGAQGQPSAQSGIAEEPKPETGIKEPLTAEPPVKESLENSSAQPEKAESGEKPVITLPAEGNNIPGKMPIPAESPTQGLIKDTGRLPVDQLNVDPKRFQYKMNTDSAGTTGSLREAKWNDQLAGALTTWKDPEDGKTYVINGHHRLELAKRGGATDIPVRMIDAKDAGEARSIGALQNIAEGRGTAIDAAKFMRDTGATPKSLKEQGLSLSDSTAANGVALSRLHQSLFDDAVSGKLPVGRAIAVGDATADPAEQEALVKLIDRAESKGKHVTNETVRELVRMVKSAGTRTESQDTLFGAQEQTHSLALEKAEVSSYIRNQIAQEKRLFGSVADSGKAERLGKSGNVIDAKANAKVAENATQAQELYDRLSVRAGGVDDILNHSAGEIADGKPAADIKRDAYERVRQTLSEALPRGAEESDRSSKAVAGRGAHSPDSGLPEPGLDEPHDKLENLRTAGTVPEDIHRAAKASPDARPDSGSNSAVDSGQPEQPASGLHNALLARPILAEPGDHVRLKDGTEGDLHSINHDSGLAILQMEDGKQLSVRAGDIRSATPPLLGFGDAVQEKIGARAEETGRKLTEAMRQPAESIDKKSGEMERHSPLFGASDANPQTSLFSKGDRVKMEDGREGTVVYAHPGMRIARVRDDAGKTDTVRLKSLSRVVEPEAKSLDYRGIAEEQPHWKTDAEAPLAENAEKARFSKILGRNANEHAVEVNSHAFHAIRKLAPEVRDETQGVSLIPSDANTVVGALRNASMQHQGSAAENLRGLADVIDESRDSHGSAILRRDLSGGGTDRVLAEERFHSWQNRKGISNSDVIDKLKDNPNYKIAAESLKQRGYKADAQTIVLETSAKLAAKADVDLGLDEERGNDALRHFFRAVADEGGVESLSDTPEMSANAQKILEEVRQEKTNANDQAVPATRDQPGRLEEHARGTGPQSNNEPRGVAGSSQPRPGPETRDGEIEHGTTGKSLQTGEGRSGQGTREHSEGTEIDRGGDERGQGGQDNASESRRLSGGERGVSDAGNASKTDVEPGNERTERSLESKGSKEEKQDKLPFKEQSAWEKVLGFGKDWIADREDDAGATKRLIRENRGEMDRKVHQLRYALRQMRDNWRFKSNDEVADFIDKIETGKTDSLPSDQRATARALSEMLAADRDEVKSLDPQKFQTFIENYFPHIWDKSGEAERMMRGMFAGKRPLHGSGSFLKERTVPSFKQGLEWGLKPVTWNPVDIALMKHMEIQRYIMGMKTVQDMKASGLSKFVRLGGDVPDGWAKLDDRFATVYSGNDAGETVLRGHYYAPHDAAGVFNRYTSKGLMGRSSVVDRLAQANQAMSSMQLGLSAFHATASAIHASVSDLANAGESLQRGRPLEAGARAVRSQVPLASALRYMRVGDHMLKEYMSPGSYEKYAREAKAVADAGGRPEQAMTVEPDAKQKFSENLRVPQIWQGIREKNLETIKEGIANMQAGKAAMGLPAAVMDLSSSWLMHYTIPRIKMGVFHDMAADILKDSADRNLPQSEITRRMDLAWNSVDNRFGQLVYDNLFWHKAALDASRVMVRSVGWNLGSAREFGGGATDAVRSAGKALSGEHPNITQRTFFTIALPVQHMVMTSAMTYLMTGHGPDTKKYGFKALFFSEKPDGTLMATPGYMKDIFGFAHAPVGTVENKMSPGISAAIQMLNNRDFYNTEIRHEDDPAWKQALGIGKFAAKQFLPFSLESIGQQIENHGGSLSKKDMARTIGDGLMGIAGFGPASKYIQNSDALNMAQDYERTNRGNGGTQTAEEFERARARRNLRDALRTGGADRNKLVAEAHRGLLSTEAIHNAERDAKAEPIVMATRSLHLDQALNVYEKANDDEKKALRPLLARKAHLLNEENDAERRDALREKLRKALHPAATSDVATIH